jgi:heterodisulfide reductase subunit B
MNLGYYPGCSLHATAKEFDDSLQAVLSLLEVELAEIKDWSCCGASSGHQTNHMLGVALPARNLWLAEQQEQDKVLAPCAACYSRLANARHELGRDKKMAKRVDKMLGTSFNNSVEVINIVQVLRELLPQIKDKVTKPLTGLKVACYYGCLLVRPPSIVTHEDTEKPTSMEEVVTALGATTVTWNKAIDCCGGGFSLSRTGSVIRLGREILEDATSAGAQAIVVGCPMCHSNLDLRQEAIARSSKHRLSIPIMFMPQLVGLAMGIPEDRLGLRRHFVNPDPVISAMRALPQPRKEV